MKPKSQIFLFILFVLLACQVVPTPPALRSTPSSGDILEALNGTPTLVSTDQTPEKVPESSPTEIVPSVELAVLMSQDDAPFAEIEISNFDHGVQTQAWPIQLPASLEVTSNFQVVDGLTLRQRRQLALDGMIVVNSQEAQFFDLHTRVSYLYGQPYLLTTDAAYHAFKQTYAELIWALEREELQPRMAEIIRSVYDQVVGYFPLTAGTDLEPGVLLSAAYLGVALKLLDPNTAIAPEIEGQVAAQLAQILGEKERTEATLFPGIQQDFSIYEPFGHYKSDINLKGYYLARTWLENVSFSLERDQSQPYSYQIPLVITLALRQTRTPKSPIGYEYTRLMEVMDFIYGHRVEAGPAEIAAIMDQTYSRYATILTLLDDPGQVRFQDLLREQPFPLSGSISIFNASGENDGKSWSFLGKREEMDVQILKRLALDTGGFEISAYSPGGLELMSVLGSEQAAKLQSKFVSEFNVQPERLVAMQDNISNQYLQEKFLTARDQWLMSFWGLPGFLPDDPTLGSTIFDQNPGWQIKALNSALGAWVDLQADSSEPMDTLVEAAPVQQEISPPAPAFVEPNPYVFYSLALLADSLAAGLQQREMVGKGYSKIPESNLSLQLIKMLDLGDRLRRFGDIAVRELAGEKLSSSDYALIQAPLGPAEERSMQIFMTSKGEIFDKMTPLPGLGILDYGGDRLIHNATGNVDRIFMLIPIEGGLSIVQGGIYSYYEFSVRRDRRLDDQSWLWRLAADAPEAPGWLAGLYLTEGTVIDVLAFRNGDLYRVLPVAGTLSVRKSPGSDSQITASAEAGDVFKILKGPQRAHGMVWWEVEFMSDTDIIRHGWIIENQDWYERVWYQ